MTKLQALKALSVIAPLALLPATSHAVGIEFQDTYLSIRYIPDNKQPGNTNKSDPMIAGNISYANGWTYGSNFVSLDFENISNHHDGANAAFGQPQNSDSFELYSVFRTTLSGNKIFGGGFSFGPIRDIGLELGGDIDTQNDTFASYKRLLVAGPQFSIDLPRGFWTISLVLSKEYNTNAFLKNGTGSNFDPTGEIETAFSFPFHLGPVPLNFTGFANFIGPKGVGGTGDFYHRMEILLRPKLLVDVGDLLGVGARKFEAGVGFEYWHNKFGSVPARSGPFSGVPGTEERSVFVEVGYHF